MYERASVRAGAEYVGMCVRVRVYPACNAYAPYYDVILQPLWLHHIFLHYLINGAIFWKKVIEHKICFDFLYNFYLEHFSLQEEFSEILS